MKPDLTGEPLDLAVVEAFQVGRARMVSGVADVGVRHRFQLIGAVTEHVGQGPVDEQEATVQTAQHHPHW